MDINWNLDARAARELQKRLSGSVNKSKNDIRLRSIAGIDVSVSRFSKTGCAAIVVLNYPSMEIVDTALYQGEINFPYIPGLLSFREAPLILEAWRLLKIQPDILLVDGQGIAHPRRFGIASHLGVVLDIPAIGCAKSRLIGSHDELPEVEGNYTFLFDGDEIVGAAVRTKQRVKPLYISIGHKIDLPGAIRIVLDCCRGYRLPEPTRLAHMAAGITPAQAGK